MSFHWLGQQQVTETQQVREPYKLMIGQNHVLSCKTLSLTEFNETLLRKKLFVPGFLILLCFAKADGNATNTKP